MNYEELKKCDEYHQSLHSDEVLKLVQKLIEENCTDLATYLSHPDNYTPVYAFFAIANELVRNPNVKYFASYTGVGQFTLLTKEDWIDSAIECANEGNPDALDDLIMLRAFENLRDAKSNIMSGINCDISELRNAKTSLRSWRK